jgi:hypothetical protein
MNSYRLAQLNIARMLAPLDSPQMAEFVARLAPINALAEASPGFVWRLQDDAGDATSIRAFDDDWIIVNMTVWESVETLREFAYQGGHAGVMRRRREWFEPQRMAYMVMWWIPAGHIPTLEEARARLEHLQAQGESEHAFTFRRVYPPPK